MNKTNLLPKRLVVNKLSMNDGLLTIRYNFMVGCSLRGDDKITINPFDRTLIALINQVNDKLNDIAHKNYSIHDGMLTRKKIRTFQSDILNVLLSE